MESVKSEIVQQRLAICRGCEFWQANHCLKGHFISSLAACPIDKFKSAAQEVNKWCSFCMSAATWSDVVTHFWRAMSDWRKSGFSVVDDSTHAERFAACRGCPSYRNFQCQECKCIAYVKTKLATETCPLTPPKWT